MTNILDNSDQVIDYPGDILSELEVNGLNTISIKNISSLQIETLPDSKIEIRVEVAKSEGGLYEQFISPDFF